MLPLLAFSRSGEPVGRELGRSIPSGDIRLNVFVVVQANISIGPRRRLDDELSLDLAMTRKGRRAKSTVEFTRYHLQHMQIEVLRSGAEFVLRRNLYKCEPHLQKYVIGRKRSHGLLRGRKTRRRRGRHRHGSHSRQFHLFGLWTRLVLTGFRCVGLVVRSDGLLVILGASSVIPDIPDDEICEDLLSTVSTRTLKLQHCEGSLSG